MHEWPHTQVREKALLAALAPLLPQFQAWLERWERFNSAEAIEAFGGEPFPLPSTITLTAEFDVEALRALLEEK